MSYSIVAVAATKAALSAVIASKLDDVVASQPVHAADIEQAKQAASAFVELATDPTEGSELYASVSGSLSWNYVPDVAPSQFTGANFSVAIHTRLIPAPAG